MGKHFTKVTHDKVKFSSATSADPSQQPAPTPGPAAHLLLGQEPRWPCWTWWVEANQVIQQFCLSQLSERQRLPSSLCQRIKKLHMFDVLIFPWTPCNPCYLQAPMGTCLHQIASTSRGLWNVSNEDSDLKRCRRGSSVQPHYAVLTSSAIIYDPPPSTARSGVVWNLPAEEPKQNHG